MATQDLPCGAVDEQPCGANPPTAVDACTVCAIAHQNYAAQHGRLFTPMLFPCCTSCCPATPKPSLSDRNKACSSPLYSKLNDSVIMSEQVILAATPVSRQMMVVFAKPAEGRKRSAVWRAMSAREAASSVMASPVSHAELLRSRAALETAATSGQSANLGDAQVRCQSYHAPAAACIHRMLNQRVHSLDYMLPASHRVCSGILHALWTVLCIGALSIVSGKPRNSLPTSSYCLAAAYAHCQQQLQGLHARVHRETVIAPVHMGRYM